MIRTKKKELRSTHSLTFTKSTWEKLNKLAELECCSVSSLTSKWANHKYREEVSRQNRIAGEERLI